MMVYAVMCVGESGPVCPYIATHANVTRGEFRVSTIMMFVWSYNSSNNYYLHSFQFLSIKKQFAF